MHRFLTILATFLTLIGFSAQAWAGFWSQNDGQCSVPTMPSGMTWLSTTDVSSATQSADEKPCSVGTDANDPSSAVCFEEGGPISTLPDLLAAMQAERAVAHVIASAKLKTDVDTETLASVEPVQPVKVARPFRVPTQECSAFDAECGPQDPIPATIMVELSHAVGVQFGSEFHPPTYPWVEPSGEPTANPGLADLHRFAEVEMPPPRRI